MRPHERDDRISGGDDRDDPYLGRERERREASERDSGEDGAAWKRKLDGPLSRLFGYEREPWQ